MRHAGPQGRRKEKKPKGKGGKGGKCIMREEEFWDGKKKKRASIGQGWVTKTRKEWKAKERGHRRKKRKVTF